MALIGAAAAALPPSAGAQTARDVEFDRRALKADMVVEIVPRGAQSVPNRFVVRNRGLRDASSASMLTVTIRLLPLTEENKREYERVMGEPFVGHVPGACAPPFGDFQVAIGPLKQGESFTATPPAPRTAASTPGVRANVNVAATNLSGTRVIALQLRMSCVYELRVVVDANEQVDESDERNEVTHRFARDVTRDLLSYTYRPR